MKNKNNNVTPEITVPKGYDIFDLIDTDDEGYDFGAPILVQEVKIKFERNDSDK